MGTNGLSRLLGAIVPFLAGCGLSLFLLGAELAPRGPRRVETPAVERPTPTPFDPWDADGASFAAAVVPPCFRKPLLPRLCYTPRLER